MKGEMTCIRVAEIGHFEIHRTAVRPPGPEEVLIRVAVAGLCRTDLKLIRTGHRDLRLPRIPGEEVVGTVVQTGERAEAVRTGELVYVYPGKWCGRCSACGKGAENLCRQMEIMGFHRDGGFAEYVTVPVRSVISVPAGLAPEQAVFAEPLSCCLNALELGGVGSGSTVAIWGAGPAGTLLSRSARAKGADPVSIEPDPRRRALIGGYPSCPDRLFDTAIVAVGSRSAYAEAIEHLAPRGRLVVFSGLSPSDDRTAVSLNRLHYHEQSFVGAYGCCYRHGVEALEAIAEGRVPVADLISHRMPLEELDAALELVEKRAGMKILLYPS